VKAIRIVLAVLALAVTIGAVTNVLVDDAEVRAQAEAVACGGHRCTDASEVRSQRTVIAESFVFTLRSGVVTVHCARAGVVVGAYRCTRE
jgi:hypothetical protein